LNRRGKKTLTTETRHPVNIQSKARTKDGEGGFTEIWANVPPVVFVSISPIMAKQIKENEGVNVDATHHIRMRGRISINETDRIETVVGGRIFEILTIENLQERSFEKFITVTERR